MRNNSPRIAGALWARGGFLHKRLEERNGERQGIDRDGHHPEVARPLYLPTVEPAEDDFSDA